MADTKELISIITDLARLVDEDRNTIASLQAEVENLKLAVRNMPWEVHDPDFTKTLRYPKIMSAKDTLDAAASGKSLCRFGDGELWQVFDEEENWPFQKNDTALGARLREVLSSHQDNILVCMSDFFGALFMKLNTEGQNVTRKNISPERRQKYLDYLEADRVYGDTFAVWPTSAEGVRGMKAIWEGRSIILIEGKKTRIGVGNDFLDNAASVRRILCPPKDAFSSYQKILSRALEEDEDSLYLIALGPTAAVLAYDLALKGRHAVDIGHADVFYEYYLAAVRGDADPNAGNLRFKDASNGGALLAGVLDTDDEKYLSQVIAEVS